MASWQLVRTEAETGEHSRAHLESSNRLCDTYACDPEADSRVRCALWRSGPSLFTEDKAVYIIYTCAFVCGAADRRGASRRRDPGLRGGRTLTVQLPSWRHLTLQRRDSCSFAYLLARSLAHPPTHKHTHTHTHIWCSPYEIELKVLEFCAEPRVHNGLGPFLVFSWLPE